MHTGLVSLGWPMFIQIINFLLLIWLLNKLLYKPVSKFLKERSEYIDNSIRQAETWEAEAKKLKEEYQEQMAQARKEAQEILQQATHQGQDNRDEIIVNAQKEANRMLERAQSEIQREKEKALAELRDEVADLAVLTAGKVIDKNLDQATHQSLINNFIEEMGDN